MEPSRMNIKSTLIAALSIGLLFITQTAHADFRKALDAYQARDGATMLKEVKDAVDKRNDDGLILFFMATNFDAITSDYDETTKQSKSTLRVILPQPKWDEMRELLVQATNNSTVDAQYYLNLRSQFSREFMVKRLQAEQVKRGEKPKNDYTNQEMNQAHIDAEKSFLDKGLVPVSNSSITSITKQAEAGDPEYQAILGFFNLGFSNDYAYQCEKKVAAFMPLCEMKKDEVKGYDWLNKATKGYEQDGLLNEGYGKFAANMCKYLIEQKTPTPKDLRQAYLWGFMAANLGSPFAEDWLGKMHRTGQLKMVAPQLDAAWEQKRNAVLYVQNIKEWPDMVLEARKSLISENTPVFSYLYTGGKSGNYALEVYVDGRVFIKELQVRGYKALLSKNSPNLIKEFLAKLHLTGLDTWTPPLYSMGGGNCYDSEFKDSFVRFTLKEKSLVRYRILTSSECVYQSRLAKVKSLVDSYFPTKQLRIELGNSDKIKQQLLGHEIKWVELAKKGESKWR
jgi:hypothetical protein